MIKIAIFAVMVAVISLGTANVFAQNVTTYENKTLGITFDYPVGWEVTQWDFSELSDDELMIEPTTWRTASYDKTDPEQVESFLDRLKTKLTLQISDVPEILDPNTLQLTPVSVNDYCGGIRASLSDKTLETSYDNDVYWLSNQIGRDEMIKLGNETACRVDSIALHDGIQESFDIDIYTMKDGKSYIITFSTDPMDVPTMVPMAERMISSFRFI